MGAFVLRRLGSMALVLFAISVLTFAIFNVIPNNDPARRLAGKNATDSQVEVIKHKWGFDRSLPVQYGKTMANVFSGDLISYQDRTNVIDQIEQGAPRTLSLALGAGVLWLICGIALGVYSAVRAGRFSDRVVTVLATIGISMPVFWVGALLNYALGFKWKIFPSGGGYVPLTDDPLQWAYHLILPWTTLALLFVGFYSRVLRSDVLDTASEDYVRTARAKGLSERRILLRHILRNSLIPIVTLWGLDFGAVVGGGAILTEKVFDLQGVGQYAADAVGHLDVPPVLAITMFGAFFIVLLSALVDIAYAALDPRIRAR